MRALFRFDASPEIGLGHQSRCLALASCLHDGSGATVSVFGHTTSNLPDWVDHHVPTSNADQSAEFSKLATDVRADLVVVDRYGLSEGWFQSILRPDRRVLRLLDSPLESPMADFVLDQSPAHSEDDYSVAQANGCELMVGAQWALIREAFFAARHIPRPRSDGPPRVLVMMGGSDPTKAVDDIIHGLQGFPTPLSITAVAAHDATRHAELNQTAAKSQHDIEVIPFTQDMARLSREFDVAIGAGGVSALERCVIGLPSVLVPTAENQLPNVRALVNAGAALQSGRAPTSLVHAVQQVFEKREHMSEAAKSVCDGLGVLRCAKALGAPPSVGLRPAVPSDKSLVYGHQVLSAVRRWFRNPEPPSWREHDAWFDSMLLDPRIDLRLIESAGYVLGQVRTDLREDGRREVSILVVPEAQGIGVATSALRALVEEHGNTLTADIHPENGASIAAFIRAGFARIGEREYEFVGPR